MPSEQAGPVNPYLALLIVIAIIVGGWRALRWLGRVLSPVWRTCRCGAENCTTCGRHR